MWLLDNRTPYAAERSWSRDKDGVHWWLVAVRGMFEVTPAGRLLLADEQQPPVLVPEYFGEPGQSSLRYDSDLLEVKLGTDVLVLGHAHAPGGRPSPTVSVALRVGPIDKQLVVYGNRIYSDGIRGLSTTSPQPFVEQPIRYELAFGGSDTSDRDPVKHVIYERNPIGRGHPPRVERWQNQPAHCIELPGGSPASAGPAGLGPIDRAWLPRRRFAGTYDATWFRTKKPLLPDDYDPRFGMCAPTDQQTANPLRGGERVSLLNLSPEGTLAFELPRVELRLFTAIGRRRHEHGATLATVTIEPSEQRLSVVWQSALRVPAPVLDELHRTEITEVGGGR